MNNVSSLSIAVTTPNSSDLINTVKILEQENLKVLPCTDTVQLCSISEESLGCAIVVEEALSGQNYATLQSRIQSQPNWSDLPIILIGSQASQLEVLASELFPQTGNLTFLVRPLSPLTLISAVRVGLRARQKQMEVRSLLEKQALSLK